MHRIVTSFFGAGFCPFAPGTAGTAVAMIPCAAALLLRPEWNGEFWLRGVWLALAVLCSAACVAWAPKVIELKGMPDPSEVVVDEAAGAYLCMSLAPALASPVLLCSAFLFFRAMDVLKPYGIRRLERLPGGWGVLLDDLAAGAAAAAVLWIWLAGVWLWKGV